MQYQIERVYDDPIHDFAFVKLFTEDGRTPGDLPEEVRLRPNEAHRGCEIRTVSNPYGLESNIGQGYIARINSNVPGGNSTDINTEYITVTMSSRGGGSSGCLAVNVKGNAVALHCASLDCVSFMLPLFLPQKALRCLQRGELVSRGTLQIMWVLKPLYECRRLRLGEQWLSRFESLEVEHLVCAKVVLPEGPAHHAVETGDILLQLDGELVPSLLQVELHMDSHVNDPIKLTCWNGEEIREIACQVDDLHALTAHHLVARQGTIFHKVSLLTAIHNNIPVRGILSATNCQQPFLGPNIIESLNGTPLSSLDQLNKAIDANQNEHFITTYLKRLDSHGFSIPYTGYQLGAIDQVRFEMRKQPQQGGPWVITSMIFPTTIRRPLPGLRSLEAVLQDQAMGTSVRKSVLVSNPTKLLVGREIFNNMFSFAAHRNVHVDGEFSCLHHGFGLVWNAEQGLAVARRGKFSIFDEIVMTISGRIEALAKVIFLHPVIDLAVLKFEITGDFEKPLRDPLLADRTVLPNDPVCYAPFKIFDNIYIETIVEDIDEASCFSDAETNQSSFKPFSSPTCQLRTPPKPGQSEGVIINEKGAVAGLLLPGSYLIPLNTLRSVTEHVLSGQVANLRFRDFDIHRMLLSDALRRGLDQRWAQVIATNQVLYVNRVPAHMRLSTSDSTKHPLRQGDIILMVDGSLVTQGFELGFEYKKPSLRVLLFRQREEIEVDVPTLSLHEVSIDTVVNFCGSWLQKPSLAVRIACHPVYSEIYTTGCLCGSPADLYELPRQAFIVGINGKRVSTMPEFLNNVTDLPFGEHFRINCVLKTHEHKVVTMKKSDLAPTIHWCKSLSSIEDNVTVNVIDEHCWRFSVGGKTGA
ncbi:hypothetical protein CABS02_14201 [Colletotrichum abscissum]|uniref:Pro-apoptotic serine protease NMA111 n=1 Tax=Colletotrichum abscissum TaxID=1671311 RepID=A0A9Q0ATQ6_9PEZI|nr:hypothetical protein CABS02_14201 [Colletotrichum abscissum]